MRLFSHSQRPVHLGPYPSEKLGRMREAPDLSRVKGNGTLRESFDNDPLHLGKTVSDYMCALDAVRDGDHNPSRAEIPDSPRERAQHMKAAGYFLDSALVGICRLDDAHRLSERIEHPLLRSTSYAHSEEKLRLRFNPGAVIRQMGRALELADRSIDHHSHAVVFLAEYPRDPGIDEPGADWITDLQEWRAALRSAETAAVMANYLRVLGYEARSHTATTTNFDLNRLAVSAGLAHVGDNGEITNPFIGPRFGLAAVTTTLEMEHDAPIREQGLADRLRAKGAAWWIGYGSPKNARNRTDFAKRNFKDSRYPVEKLKRVEKTTTYIDEERIPRVPKSSEFFLRAAFGDLGKGPMEASKDGHSVAKAPLAAALRLALNTYSLLQRGQEAQQRAKGYEDPKRNAELIKATMHFLGADICGISRAPDWVWYSHRQDGSEMKVQHKLAVSVMIDQGYETMDGASGDDWISSAQSMRTYMRAGLVCGVVAQHLRYLGFSATAHSAADSDVIQTPLVLLAGLGEVSRIGETILNPFLGPRLKTGILTTDFPMEVDQPIDFGLQKFCGSCNKCARECPSGAISSGPKVMFNGYEIWKADVEKCTRYRVTNLGGSMCGRCMKTCPWNLEGLVREAPFRWAAMNFPSAAKLIARLDDAVGRGKINPVKKWWWDIANDGTGKVLKAAETNRRDLNRHIDLKYEDQTLAAYPAPLAPPPLPMPNPVDREAGIAAYKGLLDPQDYQARVKRGETKGLTPGLKKLAGPAPVIVAQVKSRRRSSADGKIDLFEIETRDGAPMPAFTAGAHVDITVTPQFIRQFSLAGDPQKLDTYLVGILREDEGRGGSKKIHQMLKPGAPVVISQPRNHFPVIAEGKRHLLLAGGIGVTPLIAIGHELHRAGADFILYYKARTRAQSAFIEELEQVPWIDRVRFHFSDENRLDIADVLGDYRPGDHLYTCGPSPFMDAIFDTALAKGWAEDALHREYFSVPDGMEYENHPFTLELASSGTVIEVPAEQRATEALKEAGYSVDVKCSDGLCGVCSTGYLSGEVEHRDFVLSKEQRQTRLILCCSRAATADGRIVLDL
ncbi:reductive dehalogenase [Nitratireductor aquibiodomus]|uniref:Reductive dehalogenase n=1 Tax=Nitratireductor aquibiodomus TaxID=204799 RepID=A0A1H4L1W0_9HYPH|nr:reductive dehalogenase domain-containing protein [Nitratireductor aquibiodomus]SEB64764.1 reductive dehalogenase [Nitratireductor aquibiodomus]